jgi:hypothetical protein
MEKQGANIGVKGYDGMGAGIAYSGLLKGALHPNAAQLYILWEQYDPDWFQDRVKSPNFSVPNRHPAMPGSDLGASNKAVLEAKEKGYVAWLTSENNRERFRLNQVTTQALLRRTGR